MAFLRSAYSDFFLTVALVLCIVVSSLGQNQSNPKAPQTRSWSYEQFTDITEKPILIASLESEEGMHITIEQHPRLGTSAYIFFVSVSEKKLDCGVSCVINIRLDDGKPGSWPVLGPTSGPSLGLPLAQVEELIAKLRNSHHFTIEAPVLAAGRANFNFYSEGIVWPPPPALVSIRAEGWPLAERYGLHAGGAKAPPVPSCYYMPSPPLPKGAAPSDYQGTVEAEVKVTIEGALENIKILKSPDPALNESMVETLKKWRCKPATLEGGEPISITMTFQVPFKRQ